MMAIELFRIADRLIHGQVVVGWAQSLDLAFIVLVDDEVAESEWEHEWEQELYRMGVPPEMDVYFHTVEQAAEKLAEYQRDERRGALLTGDIETMTRLIDLTRAIARVNLGGIHHRVGRTQRLRYVFLAPDEEQALRAMAVRGVDVSAQDVPAARPLALDEVLSGEGNR